MSFSAYFSPSISEFEADAKVLVAQEKLSPEDKCWKTEGAVVVEPCDLCTEREIESGSPVVCSVLEHKKEKVECKESGKKTYKRWALFVMLINLG